MGQDPWASHKRGAPRVWRFVIGFILVAAVLFWAAVFAGVAKPSIWTDRTAADMVQLNLRDFEKDRPSVSNGSPATAHGRPPHTTAAGADR